MLLLSPLGYVMLECLFLFSSLLPGERNGIEVFVTIFKIYFDGNCYSDQFSSTDCYRKDVAKPNIVIGMVLHLSKVEDIRVRPLRH